jgi:hypothetical protein
MTAMAIENQSVAQSHATATRRSRYEPEERDVRCRRTLVSLACTSVR